MAKDLDSAGVYFLSVEEFERRPRRDRKDEPAAEKEQASELENDGSAPGED